MARAHVRLPLRPPVRLRRLRAGERTAAVGALASVLALLLTWSDAPGPGGGHGPGTVVVVLVLLAALAAGGALVATAASEAPTLPVGLTNAAVPLALLALAAVVVRIAWGDAIASAGAFAALVAVAVLFGGLWHMVGDERTDAEEARELTARALAVGGPPRPAPPAAPEVPAETPRLPDR